MVEFLLEIRQSNSRVKRNLIVSLKKEEEKMETNLVGENVL